MLVKKNAGAIKYVNKMEAEREALQRTHAEDLQDMQNLLEEKEKQLTEKQNLLDQKNCRISKHARRAKGRA